MSALATALRWLASCQGIERAASFSMPFESNDSSGGPVVARSNDSRKFMEVVVLCGSAVLSNIHDAVSLACRRQLDSPNVEDVLKTSSPCEPHRPILITGGIGHSTEYLIRSMVSNAASAHRECWLPNWSNVLAEYHQLHQLNDDESEDECVARLLREGRSEAKWIAEIIRLCFGIPQEWIWLEEQSTNCGANAQCSIATLQQKAARTCGQGDPAVLRLFVIQDPTMQRRTILSFLRHIDLVAHHSSIEWELFSVETSAASFVAGTNSDGATIDDDRALFTLGYHLDRLVSLVVGEHQRLQPGPSGYGPGGKHFIVDGGAIPFIVHEAFTKLEVEYGVAGR